MHGSVSVHVLRAGCRVFYTNLIDYVYELERLSIVMFEMLLVVSMRAVLIQLVFSMRHRYCGFLTVCKSTEAYRYDCSLRWL